MSLDRQEVNSRKRRNRLEGDDFIYALKDDNSDYAKLIKNLNLENENFIAVVEEFFAIKANEQQFAAQHQEEIIREELLAEERAEKEKEETIMYLAYQQQQQRTLMQKISEKINSMTDEDYKKEVNKIETRIAVLTQEIQTLKQDIVTRQTEMQTVGEAIQANDNLVAAYVGDVTLQRADGTIITVNAVDLIPEQTPGAQPLPVRVVDVVLGSQIQAELAKGKTVDEIQDEMHTEEVAANMQKMKAIVNAFKFIRKLSNNEDDDTTNLATRLNDGQNRKQINGAMAKELHARMGEIYKDKKLPDGCELTTSVVDYNAKATQAIVKAYCANLKAQQELEQKTKEAQSLTKLHASLPKNDRQVKQVDDDSYTPSNGV